MNKKCQIADITATDLGTAYGIPEIRQDEISTGLDDMVREFGQNPVCVYAVHVIDKIEDLCNTQEEFTWAIMNHIQWLAKTGRLLPSFKKQK